LMVLGHLEWRWFARIPFSFFLKAVSEQGYSYAGECICCAVGGMTSTWFYTGVKLTIMTKINIEIDNYLSNYNLIILKV